MKIADGNLAGKGGGEARLDDGAEGVGVDEEANCYCGQEGKSYDYCEADFDGSFHMPSEARLLLSFDAIGPGDADLDFGGSVFFDFVAFAGGEEEVGF